MKGVRVSLDPSYREYHFYRMGQEVSSPRSSQYLTGLSYSPSPLYEEAFLLVMSCPRMAYNDTYNKIVLMQADICRMTNFGWIVK